MNHSFILKLIMSAVVYSSLSQAVIYGSDNRLEVKQVASLKQIAPAVAALVPKIFLKKVNEQFYQVTDYEKLGGSSSVNACLDEKFAQQTIIPNCTGFLISDRLLVTAGHCLLPNGIIDNQIDGPFCENFTWYFNYNLDAAGKTTIDQIPAENIYGCKRVVHAENIDLSPPGNPSTNYGPDFAVIELDRPVVATIKPLKMNTSLVKKNDLVFAVGHPTGLPAKYSGTGPILKTDNELHFSVNLDTLGGNSGSPVFNTQNEVVGILVGGHPVDYTGDKFKNCQRVNKCDQSGKVCTENSSFKDLDVSNSIQRISIIEKYLRL